MNIICSKERANLMIIFQVCNSRGEILEYFSPVGGYRCLKMMFPMDGD